MGRYKIRCRICNKLRKRLCWIHLRTHNITLVEYKKKYPDAKICSDEVLRNLSKAGLQASKNMKKKRKNEIFNKKYKLKQKKIGSLGGKKTHELYGGKKQLKWCSIGGKLGGKKGGKNTQKIIKKERKKDKKYDKWIKNLHSKTGQIGRAHV